MLKCGKLLNNFCYHHSSILRRIIDNNRFLYVPLQLRYHDFSIAQDHILRHSGKSPDIPYPGFLLNFLRLVLTVSIRLLSVLQLRFYVFQGRAEPMRLACVIGKVPFTDDRIPSGGWMKVKPSTPLGAVPVVEIDGKTAVQSQAILRYIGKLTNMYPSDPLEALNVDQVVDTLADFGATCFRYRGPDKDKLKEERVKMLEQDLPRYMGGLLKILEDMGHKGPYLVGDSVTTADLNAFSLVTNFKCGIMDHVPTDALDSYKPLIQSFEAILAIPEVAEWYKKHPIPNVTN